MDEEVQYKGPVLQQLVVSLRNTAKVFKADKEIGLVTSGGYGPSVSAAVAMGYVDFNCSEVGTSVELEVRGKKYPAKVCLLPFYKKSYAK